MLAKIRNFFRITVFFVVVAAVLTAIIVGVVSHFGDTTRQAYNVEQVHYEVDLRSDGTASVEETWTFAYNRGSFTFAYVELDSVATNIRVSENGQFYTQLEQASSDRPVRHFTVQDRGNHFYIEWYYRTQSPETRNYTLHYDIPEAAIAYSDTVVYFQKYLSETNTTDIGLVTATVNLPQGADSSNTLIWGHGPGHGNLDFNNQNPNQVDLSIKRPGTGNYVEARFLMPRDSLSNPSRVENFPVYEDVYAEEIEAARQADRFTLLSRVFFVLALIIVIALLVITILLRKKHKDVFTKHQPEMAPPFYREIPAQVPPAIASRLFFFYKKSPKESELISHSILDMIYRQVIFVTPQQNGRKTETWMQLAQAPDGKLDILDHEKPIIEFLFREVSKGEPHLTVSQLNSYCKKQRNVKPIQTMLTEFKAKLDRLWSAYQYEEKKKNKVPSPIYITRVLSALAAGLGFFLIGAATEIPTGSAGIVLLAGGAVTFLLSIILMHKVNMLNQKGENLLALWQGLERFFKEFSTFDEKEIPEIGFWEKLLVYAAALGCADTVMKQLPTRYPQLQDQQYLYANYYFLYSVSRMNTTNQFGSGFSGLQNSINAAMSNAQHVVTARTSSSGGGGGFSGGGSSGGGGAGGSGGGGAG